MKKLLALVMAILMVLCTFASCGGGSASGNTELPDDEKQQTEDSGQSGNIENDKTENGGQNNQDNNGQNTGNNTGSNNGGNGGTSACAHVDDDKNHSCDKCNDKTTDCADASKDHECDICGNKLTDCADNDKNHACDICTIKLSDCADNNKDHNCDLCGADNGVAHIEGEGKHSCDYCGIVISICIDNDTDHKCDQCGATGMGAHADGDDNDHLCDYCEQSVGEDCYDIEPKDHICDECGAPGMSTHIDNHFCEYCCQIGSECADNDFDHNCDDCGGMISTHNYQDSYCTICGEEEPLYTREENKITFGSYPQTKVTDSSLTSTLTSMAGTLPTSSNSQAWTSYGYYINGKVSNFMWYIDITTGGEKYRGVYFRSYRPSSPGDTSSKSNSYQDDNGYTIFTVYWFKYEPISWTILSEDAANGTALILCDMIIDAQQYDYDGSYSNNYAESTIRKWLNESFYNTAFNELQKQMIVTTTVDNSAESTGHSSNKYACENTEDKIFLISRQDVINSNYGFSSKASLSDDTRQKKTTDYAKAQGAHTHSGRSYVGNGNWWLRAPDNYYSDTVYRVDISGTANGGVGVGITSSGVVPALQIRL